MKNILLVAILLFAAHTASYSQVQLNHPQKMWRNKNGRLFANKHQSMYLMLSTSPGTTGDTEQLESESGPKYANPFYFDSEGLNTIRTPSQVDPETKELVYPIKDVVFEVYADGIAPQTKSYFTNAKKHTYSDTVYYSNGLKISFSTYDKTSGTEATYYSINAEPYQIYEDTLVIKTEGKYELKYYSIDHVGNIELVQKRLFIIDTSAPVVSWKMHGDVAGKIVSARSKIELIALDTGSGLRKIQYQLNENEIKTYKQPIALSTINSGKHEFKFWAVDNVGNQSSNNDSANSSAGSEIATFSFVIDYDPPEASVEIINDSYKGKYIYVSERSLCKLDAKDNQLVISKIIYGPNKLEMDKTYSDPFAFDHTLKSQTIYYQSFDVVENHSNVGQLSVISDTEAPTSGIDFEGNIFFNRDTLFINKNTKVKLFAQDAGSGVKSTEYQINDTEFIEGKEFTIQEDGWHTIKFFSIDNVNNKETLKESGVYVDNIGPEIFINCSIKPTRQEQFEGKTINVYPPFIKLYIGATDKNCGTESIYYSIDNGEKKNYASNGSPAHMELFKQEKVYSVSVEAKDKLGNIEQKTLQFKVAKH
ncbi:OmpL47-type beta-barrel domain-containing protein [Saccharicrinis aurantiacus]|uniref:OmpL47-type beta-barrel domain-containing protein n=1 Tax=Saccharicrinis aurantiacus TaxID=1849719 RepID=UPI00094F9423|nr:hypothetical protein [Saccharicrinis aurantiacus]